MNKNEKIIEEIEKYGMYARGRSELIKYLEGKDITQKQAIMAKCYDCMGYYGDGRGEVCLVTRCPLYLFMPYNPNRRKSKNLGTTKA